jgi:hypothetical protein
MEELIKRYLELYNYMASSAQPENMMIFGEAEKWAFKKMSEISPKTAQMWLDKLEAMYWNNFLSKAEAEEIVTKFENQDGTRGAHWNYDTFKAAVESLGGAMSEAPFYNCYALWVVANMLYSDYARTVAEFVPKEEHPKFFYKMAVSRLKDVDHPRFVREYFKV